MNYFFIISRPSVALAFVCWHTLFANTAIADTDTTLNVSGYLETYYAHDFEQNAGARPNFIYSHNIANQPSINLAMIKAAFNAERVRATLAIGSGTYMREIAP